MALLGLFYGQETFSKVNQLRIRPKLYAFVAAGLMGHCPLVMYTHALFCSNYPENHRLSLKIKISSQLASTFCIFSMWRISYFNERKTVSLSGTKPDLITGYENRDDEEERPARLGKSLCSYGMEERGFLQVATQTGHSLGHATEIL